MKEDGNDLKRKRATAKDKYIIRKDAILSSLRNSDIPTLKVITSEKEFQKAFKKLSEAHGQYMGAKYPDGEDPELTDVTHMDALIAGLQEGETHWTRWCNAREKVQQDADRANREETRRREREGARAEEEQRRANEKVDAADKAAAEKTRDKEALSSRFTTRVRAIGDPDKDIGELITSGIIPAALRNKAIKLETQLRNLEAGKDQLVALEGEAEANRCEQMMQDDARPKVKTALMRAEKWLNGK